MLFMLFVLPYYGITQVSNLRVKTLNFHSDTIKLDSLSIYPNSFSLSCSGTRISESGYNLDYAAASLVVFTKCSGPLKVTYRVLPMDLSKTYAKRDTRIIYSKNNGFRERFLISNASATTDVFGGVGLNKSGSISRGISFGNNQDLGVNSSLNLELSGQIAPNLKLLASISDDNLPIQPDGHTNT
jgi:hypothetical protein